MILLKQYPAAPSHVIDFLKFVATDNGQDTDQTDEGTMQHVGLLTLVTDALTSAMSTDPSNPIYQIALEAVQQEKQVFKGA